MKKIISTGGYESSRSEVRDIYYSLMVRRDAMRASHIRMARRLKTVSVH